MDAQVFEDEVRRLARALWPSQITQGAEMLAGRERDGIFWTEESVHIIEATTSRQKSNVSENAGKLRNAKKTLSPQAGDRTVTGWIITKHEPTAEQRGVLRREDNIRLMSFSEFQAKLVDARAYLSARSDQAFGSVRDPADNAINPSADFIPPDFYQSNGSNIWSYRDIQNAVSSGQRVVVVGEYGAGKSMTLRQVFFELRKQHQSNKTPKFPVYINLRDHAGQTYPAEILERHARDIGFHAPHHLVRAWRAGYVDLLVDGFDELASTLPYGMWSEIRQHRYRTVEGIRRLIVETPPDSGILICGRTHFFGSHDELRIALGLHDAGDILDLSEFTRDQVTAYLTALDFPYTQPLWLPSRPLLLGYLVSTGTLASLIQDYPEVFATTSNSAHTPGYCWNVLLDKIAQREAQIEPGIQAASIRMILERLATYARQMESALGPLSLETLQGTFQEVCGFPADQRGLTLLQRLPGLTVTSGNELSRHFVDREFAGACSAGDIARYIEDPFNANDALMQSLEVPIGRLGSEVATHILSGFINIGTANAAIGKARKTNNKDILLSDLVEISKCAGIDITEPVTVANATYSEYALTSEGPSLMNVNFRECMFERLYVEPMLDCYQLPVFDTCYIVSLEGRSSDSDLPQGKFSDCDIDEFSDAPTSNTSIQKSELPLDIRVAISILKKLYLQAGSGRQESALYRGLDHHGRQAVPKVLTTLVRHELAHKSTLTTSSGDTIWRPTASETARARRIISAPSTCADPIIDDLR